MKLDNAKLVKELLDAADRDILQPIEAGAQANLPNAAALGQWLQQHMAKSTSLFQSDPKSTIGIP
jgi:hypothetical protein